MWWAGDVRDYWMALTILETIGVFINVSNILIALKFRFYLLSLYNRTNIDLLQVYCVVVVMMYYRRINITTDEYEGKDRRVKYKVNRHGYSNRRDLMDSYAEFNLLHSDQGRQTRTPEQIMKSPYPNYMTPIHQPYPPYSPSDIHYPPSQLPKYSAAPPYPIDSNEPIFYDREPKSRIVYEAANEDPVAHWVKDQQKIERTEANSEPVSPSKEVLKSYPMQHSRSVPSMFDGTLVSHKSCRHGKYRSDIFCYIYRLRIHKTMNPISIKSDW
uniref:G_PROTEIN_RECEP_F1_2 domain-containing protein n=1 Tax=Heterorhabditis bacteriophora TaxID=37862 RepID=A0A1I7X277_HETBA